MATLGNTTALSLNVLNNITTSGTITGNGSGLTNLNASNIGSGTLSVDRLADSGVTATSYGPSTNATPGYSGTFNVPYITVDDKGRVTKAETKTITIPVLGTSSTTAAAGDHNHDGRYLKWNGSAANVDAMGWGTLTANNGYTILSHASSGDGGDWGMVNKDGKIFMQLDGYYYQNEGQYRVLDTSDSGSFATSDHTHSSIRDIGNDATTTFAYSKAGLNYDEYTWLAGWNNYELRAVNKSQFARASHNHAISDVTNLQTTLNGKVNSSDLVALTLTNNSTKRYLIGSTSATTWSGVGTNSSCYTSSGNLYATYFYGTSDRRLKENIKDLDLNCLDLVNNINLREFSWKADETHKPVIGAIAQELNQVLPEKYRHEFIGGQETKDEYLSINDSKLVYLLIGAIQEQQKEIESLKAKIDSKIV